MKRIFTYNVNGIRAALNKGLAEWLRKARPDVLMIQESKAQKEQVDTGVFEKLGYSDYWFSAEKKGYSGVCILSLEEPDHIEYGMGIREYDMEGRTIRADFGELSLLNVYIPSGTTGDIRQDFKMLFLERFLDYLNRLRMEKPNLMVSGDFNIAHREIDIHNPVSNKKSSGFLPEERAWVDGFLASGFEDSYRKMNPEVTGYTWWSFRSNARAKNLGWRLDYNMATTELAPRIINAGILPEVHHSDHCPAWVELNI